MLGFKGSYASITRDLFKQKAGYVGICGDGGNGILTLNAHVLPVNTLSIFMKAHSKEPWWKGLPVG